MLGKVRPLTRYHVKVLTLKHRKGPKPRDTDVFMMEGDDVFGYSYRRHREGKYFDLWFNHDISKDRDNFITLGRIKKITKMTGSLVLFETRLGRFLVEEKRAY